MAETSPQSPNGNQRDLPPIGTGLFPLRTVVVCLGSLLIGALAGALMFAQSGSWPTALLTVLSFAGAALVGLHQLTDRR